MDDYYIIRIDIHGELDEEDTELRNVYHQHMLNLSDALYQALSQYKTDPFYEIYANPFASEFRIPAGDYDEEAIHEAISRLVEAFDACNISGRISSGKVIACYERNLSQ